MDASPLVQQARPSFKPKISQLYEELFQDDENPHSEGYWSEFFLLKPDRASLSKRLDKVSTEELLHFQDEAQDFFTHAVMHVKAGQTPSDEFALDTLTVFLAGVLSKRYTNPSSDIIMVLAGLETVDSVFTDFANALETAIRNGKSPEIRRKAIDVALSLTSGAYQTSLVSYFTHRDLFPALMKYIQEVEMPERAFEPFVLLGLLANYNKFEFRNPYRMRLEDFVNEKVIEKVITGFSATCTIIRRGYTEVIDDLPVDPSWTLSNTLSWMTFGMLAPIKAINPIAAPEDYKQRFDPLPGPEASVLLAVYDFANANKLFNFSLISTSFDSEPAFAAYLSMISYVLHHAYRSSRATLWGLLSLSTLRIVLEDPPLCKQICNSDKLISVRLCRQRPPLLPPTPTPRAGAAQIFDIAIDTINHNLRRRLDLDLYGAVLKLVHRLLICLAQNHMHLAYHWSLLWQALLSLMRFMQTYATDILTQPTDAQMVISPLLKSIALAIARGNAFLPDPAAYDDLFYKLVENAPVLGKFKSAFKLYSGAPVTSKSGNHGTPTPGSPATIGSPIDVLIAAASHFHTILEEEKGKGRLRLTLSTREVTRVVRDGYDSLEIADVSAIGVEHIDVWRESEERGLVKRAGRIAIEDVRRLMNDSRA